MLFASVRFAGWLEVVGVAGGAIGARYVEDAEEEAGNVEIESLGTAMMPEHSSAYEESMIVAEGEGVRRKQKVVVWERAVEWRSW